MHNFLTSIATSYKQFVEKKYTYQSLEIIPASGTNLFTRLSVKPSLTIDDNWRSQGAQRATDGVVKSRG